MADGTTRPISDIELGDQVAATTPETGETRPETVTQLGIHDDTLIDLDVDGNRLTTTEDHPFWNVTDQQWQQAQTLDAGDHLLTVNGTTIPLGSGLIWTTAHFEPAYNLTIANIHTYYVLAGTTPLLVHNTNGCRPPNLSPAGAGRDGAFNQAKRDSGVPTSMSPTRTIQSVDRRGNPQPGSIYEFDVPAPGGGTRTIRIRDDAGGHVFPDDSFQNRGPHFNTENGGHYDY